jgi:hypothetical protein
MAPTVGRPERRRPGEVGGVRTSRGAPGMSFADGLVCQDSLCPCTVVPQRSLQMVKLGQPDHVTMTSLIDSPFPHRRVAMGVGLSVVSVRPIPGRVTIWIQPNPSGKRSISSRGRWRNPAVQRRSRWPLIFGIEIVIDRPISDTIKADPGTKLITHDPHRAQSCHPGFLSRQTTHLIPDKVPDASDGVGNTFDHHRWTSGTRREST